MRILIVDDEVVSRSKMAAILGIYGHCDVVESGRAAIAAFEAAWEVESPYALITLDIGMPDMDGTEVLFSIREYEARKAVPAEKKTRIIMVTSHSDRGNIVTCLQAGCNDYVVKPFNRETVSKKLVGLPVLQGIEETPAPSRTQPTQVQQQKNMPDPDTIIAKVSLAMKKGEVEIPSLPDIHVRLKELISQGTNLDAVAVLLKEDIAISSKLIRVANSAYYNAFSGVQTVEEAVTRLGLSTTRQYVEALSNRSFYESLEKRYHAFGQSLWHHAFLSACYAQTTAKQLGIQCKRDPFTLGLLHGVGKIALLLTLSDLMRKGKFEQPLSEDAVFATIRKYHEQFGSALLNRWGFPKAFQVVALYQARPESAPSHRTELDLIHLACQMARKPPDNENESPDEDNTLSRTPSAGRIGLSLPRILEIRNLVQTEMESVADVVLRTQTSG